MISPNVAQPKFNKLRDIPAPVAAPTSRTTEGHQKFNGNIGGIRFTQGLGRYTGNFDVPTAPFPEA